MLMRNGMDTAGETPEDFIDYQYGKPIIFIKTSLKNAEFIFMCYNTKHDKM